MLLLLLNLAPLVIKPIARSCKGVLHFPKAAKGPLLAIKQDKLCNGSLKSPLFASLRSTLLRSCTPKTSWLYVPDFDHGSRWQNMLLRIVDLIMETAWCTDQLHNNTQYSIQHKAAHVFTINHRHHTREQDRPNNGVKTKPITYVIEGLVHVT